MIRVFGYFISKVFLALALVELLMLGGALYLGVYVGFDFRLPEQAPAVRQLRDSALLFALVMFGAMLAMGLYQRGVLERASGFIVRLLIAYLLGAALSGLLFYLVPELTVGLRPFVLALLFSFAAILIVRAQFVRLTKAESRKRRVLVLGTGINADRIEELVTRSPNVEFVVVGYVPMADSISLIEDHKQIVGDRSLLQIAIERQVDEIVVAVDDRRKGLPVEEILDCKMSGFQILDLLTFFEKEQAVISIDLLHPSWIFFSSGFHRGMVHVHAKRLLDLLLGVLLLILTFPLMVAIALVSKLASLGRDPVIYSQLRVGQNGRPFYLHKFRSMRVDAEEEGRPRWAKLDDERVTRLGAILRRTRLDELPQLFNVIKGEMSLVGPRPERPPFVKRLAREIPFYSERHRVKPGITGWAQLMYHYGANREDAKRKLEYDLYYVKNSGIFLDLIIMLETVEVMLLAKGAR